MKRFLMTMVFAAVFMATSAQAADGKLYFSGSDGIPLPIDVDLSALTFMAYGYYDVEMKNSPLTPYLGVGLGLVSSEIDGGVFGSADEEDFGYQFMVGLGFDVTPSTLLTADYRFLGIADSDSPNTHAFIFGARFMFQ